MKTILVTTICALLASFTSYAFGAAEVHLYALDCGEITDGDLGFLSDTNEYDGRRGDLAVTCFLIHHSEGGWLLWDTGYPDKIVGNPVVRPFGTMSRAKRLIDQLRELHLLPRDIKYLALSHVHPDHTGNAGLFVNEATWLLQQKELDFAVSTPTPQGVEPPTLAALKSAKHKNLLHGDFDVFGDGRVRILSMPGHTPGHQSLLVRLKDEGNVIISGDLFHQRESFEHKRVPNFNVSRADTLASFDRLEHLMTTYSARFFIQHEKGDFAKLPKFPEFWK